MGPKVIHKFSLRVPHPDYHPGGGLVDVEPGDLIIYVESYTDGSTGRRIGRVLDRPLYAADGKKLKGPHLRVLVAAEDFSFGYVRYVQLEDIRIVSKPSSEGAFDFARLFFQAELPSVETIEAMQSYGSLSDAYLAKDLERRGLSPIKK